MKRRKIVSRTLSLALSLLIIAVFTPGLLQQVSAQTGGGFDLSWSTVNGGGSTTVTGGGYSLSGTTGQPDAGGVSGGGFAMISGFWAVVADSTLPTLSIDDISVAEGNSGTTTFVYTVTLTGASAQTVTVSAQTADGTATAGSDYTAAGPSLVTFPVGVTTQQFLVAVNGDTTVEPNETFAANLTSATNATILKAQGVATVVNDDVAPPSPSPSPVPNTPSISINDATITEGNTGTTNLVFTVSLSAASAQTVTVSSQTANGTATAGVDYTAVGPTTLTFAAGETTKTVSVPIIGEDAVESDEDFFVNLSSPTNAVLADGQGRGLIQNDDYDIKQTPDDTDKERKETPAQRYQRERTNRSSQDDSQTEGNVVEIRANAEPPVVIIANKDGLVEVRLFGDARKMLPNLAIGQYVTVSGEKENELLYNAEDISID